MAEGTTITGKYLVLVSQLMWRDPDSGFELNWFDPDQNKWWAKVADIPEEALSLVQLGLKSGILATTNSYKKWYARQKADKASEPSRRDRLVWTELEREDVKANRFAPRNPSIARNTLVYGDQETDAFKALQRTAVQLREELPARVAAMSKDNATAFLREALELEKRGYNRAMHARASVIDLLVELMADMGITSGITSVTEEAEPITKDVKPLRIAL